MQVVYSGGSTPTPSPRHQRKQYGGYGRPVLPGYVLGPPPSAKVHRSPTKEKRPPSAPVQDDSTLRDSIPVMSKPLAITCLVCNVILPGLGMYLNKYRLFLYIVFVVVVLLFLLDSTLN